MISFIIINFNGIDDTLNCVKSIMKFFKTNYEIVLIDNSINNDDFNTLSSIYKNIENIQIHKIINKGFGNACNVGADYSNGDILFFLNNDTLIDEVNELESLTNLVINNNYIVTPTVLNEDGSIQKNIGGFFSILSSIIYFLQLSHKIKNNPIINKIAKLFFKKNKTIQIYLNSNNNFTETNSIDWVSGCSLIISKNNYINIGGFDENYFMYFEDQDLCYSHHLKGFKCFLFREIKITHYIGGSQKELNFKMELIKLKSLMYFAQKNIKNGFLLKYIIFFISLPILFFNKRINFLFRNYYFK